MLAVSEMLMRQLLKLDGIEADGDAKAMRRTEVFLILMIFRVLMFSINYAQLFHAFFLSSSVPFFSLLLPIEYRI